MQRPFAQSSATLFRPTCPPSTAPGAFRKPRPLVLFRIVYQFRDASMRDSDARGSDAPAPGRNAPPSVRDALQPPPPRDAVVAEDGTAAEGDSVQAVPSPAKPPHPAPTPAAKPVPIRQAVPPPSKPVPARGQTPDPPPKPVPARAEVPGPSPKPVPARDGAPPPAARETTPPPARVLDRAVAPVEPSRDVKLGEETWTVRLKGAATVGSGHAGARILSVGFEAPKRRVDPDETRYVLARTLEDVGEDELLSLVREVAQRPDATPEPAGRGRRGRGRRGGRRRGRT